MQKIRKEEAAGNPGGYQKMKKNMFTGLAFAMALTVGSLANMAPLAAAPSFDVATASEASVPDIKKGKATPSEATPSEATEYITDSVHYMLPEPERDGYVFVEWNTERDGSGDAYDAGEEIELSDQSLYAIWEAEDVEDLATPSDAEEAKGSLSASDEDDGDVIPDMEILPEP